MLAPLWPYFRNAVIFFPITVFVMILFDWALAGLTGGVPRYTYRNLLSIIGVLLYTFVAQLGLVLSPIHTYVLRHELLAKPGSRWRRSACYALVLGSLATAWLFPTIAFGATVLDIIPASLIYGVLIGFLDVGSAPALVGSQGPNVPRATLRDYVRNAILFILIGAVLTTILLAVGAGTGLIPSHYFPTLEWFASSLFRGATVILGILAAWFSAAHTFLLWRVSGSDRAMILRRSVGLALGLAILATFGYVKGEPKNLLLIPSALVYGWAVAYLRTRQLLTPRHLMEQQRDQ